jgi:hypothetical protein
VDGVVLGVLAGVLAGALAGVLAGVVVGVLPGALVDLVVLGLVVVEEPIDGTFVLVEEVGVVGRHGTDVKGATGAVAVALPATPRYSHETVTVGTGQVRGHCSLNGNATAPVAGAIALQPGVPAAVTCQSVPAGGPVPS